MVAAAPPTPTSESSATESTPTTATTAAASSISSSTNPSNGKNTESEIGDSNYYYPGCRKDAKCNCEICLASLNATLDLMPQSIQRSSLTMLSSSRAAPRTPVSFHPSSFSTPRTKIHRDQVSPPLDSTARVSLRGKIRTNNETEPRCWLRFFLILSSLLALEFGVSWMVSGILRPQLSIDSVRTIGEKSWVFKDLNERLKFVKKHMEGVVVGEVSDCSSTDANWDINHQDGLLLYSYCSLYKSATEEVGIWGWPLQTSGLLTTELSSRAHTILTGRVAEWSSGEFNYRIRSSNSSWTQEKWSSAIVQLSPSTWILQYQANPIFENSRLISASLELLKFRIRREIQEMKRNLWAWPSLGRQYNDLSGNSFTVPT